VKQHKPLIRAGFEKNYFLFWLFTWNIQNNCRFHNN